MSKIRFLRIDFLRSLCLYKYDTNKVICFSKIKWVKKTHTKCLCTNLSDVVLNSNLKILTLER